MDLAAKPEDYLEHDYFVPGGSSGVRRHRFPFTLSMLLALRHYRVRAELAGVPAYTEFYDPGHPAEGLELTSRILERFAAKARERGIDVVDLGSRLMEVVGDGDPCALYLRCNNHFNAHGNELLARQVVAALDERRIRQIAASQGRWPYEIRAVDVTPAVAAGPPE